VPTADGGLRAVMSRPIHPVQWLRGKDREFAALRRAARTAIIMPALFALGVEIIGNPTIATFAAFGSFAMLLLVDFGGSIRERVESQIFLGAAGAVLVALGTAASQEAWLAALAMAAVAFIVLFAGVVSSVLAGAAPSLLLAFILPAATTAPLSDIPDRMAGWGLAATVSVFAIALMWPTPAHDPIRAQAGAACRALATRLRSDVAYRLSNFDPAAVDAHNEAVVRANAEVATLRTAFLASPYRPTGLSTPARAVVRLIDAIQWLNSVVVKTSPVHKKMPIATRALDVKARAAAVLDRVADVLDGGSRDVEALREDMAKLHDVLIAMDSDATRMLPVHRITEPSADGDRVTEIVTSLDPSFRAQELSFAVGQIGANVERMAVAERRGWLDRVLGRQPEGLAGPLAAARERAAAHLERHSVWLHNSVRGAVALGAAIYVANLTGVQHSFWVVLGTLSVLRSNALNTGQNIVRGLLGTAVGFAVGGALLVAIGTNSTVLWILLPFAILIAGVAPAAISFAAGQAGFTITLLILFNIVAPAGWRVGLIRIEDVAIGGAVSLAVGVLFWPRGAAAALGIALSEAYADSAAYLNAAVRYGVSRCARHPAARAVPTPIENGLTAAAAARRLDDTFRTYLSERGAKPVPMAEITSLLTGVASVRLAGDAVHELWQRDEAPEPGDREAVRRELLDAADTLRGWFDAFSASLTGVAELPGPTHRDEMADGRLIDAVRTDLTGDDGYASATAVRVIWTGDHLDAVRRLQPVLIEPARAAIDHGGIATPRTMLLPVRLRRARAQLLRHGPVQPAADGEHAGDGQHDQRVVDASPGQP
jgi:uncharacterized membrane protein YccC